MKSTASTTPKIATGYKRPIFTYTKKWEKTDREREKVYTNPMLGLARFIYSMSDILFRRRWEFRDSLVFICCHWHLLSYNNRTTSLIECIENEVYQSKYNKWIKWREKSSEKWMYQIEYEKHMRHICASITWKRRMRHCWCCCCSQNVVPFKWN